MGIQVRTDSASEVALKYNDRLKIKILWSLSCEVFSWKLKDCCLSTIEDAVMMVSLFWSHLQLINVKSILLVMESFIWKVNV